MKIAVIGAGIGGLASAIRLAASGHSVAVFEKNYAPGGKISEHRKSGFRFDTGPSLFTLPELAGELFDICGKDIRDYLDYVRLETNCKYFFPSGTVFNFFHEKERLTKEIADNTKEKPEKIFDRLRKSEEAYNLGAPVFLFNNFRKLSNFTTEPFRKMPSQLHKLDFFRTMHRANSEDFDDPEISMIFDRYATYNGSSPFRVPATLNMIAHLENNLGAFSPKRGMYSIVEALYRLAVDAGVEFRLGEKVDKIIVNDRLAAAVKTAVTEFPVDAVVCAVDARYAAENLFEYHPIKKRLNRAEPSSSAMIFY